MTEDKPAPYSLCISGSREIRDRRLVFNLIDLILSQQPSMPTKIYHGGAQGVDTLAGQWARVRGIPVVVMRPDFERWGRGSISRAYLKRDEELVDAADRVLAIWNGKSRGTLYTFRYAQKRGKLLAVRKILNGAVVDDDAAAERESVAPSASAV